MFRFSFPRMLAASIVAWVLFAPNAAFGQEPKLVERLFRSVLTEVTPIFESGQEGNRDAVIGLRTESTVFEIHEPIENGLIPRPRASDAEPIGRMFGELRCLGGAHVDKSKPMQVFAGTARFVGRAMQFEAAGTSIIHWCQGDDGAYNGIRWTDFSGAITRIQGRHEGAKGHVVGTRLLIGDPQLRAQSGMIILRLVDES
jgi:hypothetical protein